MRSSLSGKKVQQKRSVVDERKASELLTKKSDDALARVLADEGFRVVEELKHELTNRSIWLDTADQKTKVRRRRLKVFGAFQQQTMNATKTKLQYIVSQRKYARYHVVSPWNAPFIKDSDLSGGDLHQLAYYVRNIVQTEAKKVNQHYVDTSFMQMLFRSTEVTFVRSKDLQGNEGYFLNVHYNVLVDSKFTKDYDQFLEDSQKEFKSLNDSGRLENVQEITKYVTKPGEMLNIPDQLKKVWALAICGSTLDPTFIGRSLRLFSFGQTKENAYITEQREEGKKLVVDFDKDGEPELMLHQIRQYTEKNGSGAVDPVNVVLASQPPTLDEIDRKKDIVEYIYNPRWLFMGSIDDKKLHLRLRNNEGKPSYFSRTLREQIEAGFRNKMNFGDLSQWVQNLVKQDPFLSDLAPPIYLGQKTANSLSSGSEDGSLMSGSTPKPPPKRVKIVRKVRKSDKLFA